MTMPDEAHDARHNAIRQALMRSVYADSSSWRGHRGVAYFPVVSRAWLLCLVACGHASPPSPTAKVAAREPPLGSELFVTVPRPDVDLSALAPNLDGELRWPLSASAHPALDPHFPIADALAEPGVSWTELCRRGVQDRHLPTDEGWVRTVYLHAWCFVADHDVEQALDYFTTAIDNGILGQIALDARLDVASVLAETGNADTALHLLAKHPKIGHDELDILAATYLEINRPDDARDVNHEALEYTQVEPARCHRELREIALADPADRERLVRVFARHPTSDAVCTELRSLAACWANPAHACHDYLVRRQLDLRALALFEVYFAWPTGPQSTKGWSMLAQLAIDAAPLDGAVQLAIVALEAARRTSGCTQVALHRVADQAQVLAHELTVSPELAPRLAAITDAHCSTAP